MALIEIFRSNPEQIYKLAVDQIVSICGNGQLLDDADCSVELRGFFREATSEKLFEYVGTCLDKSFAKSGQVLQDLVNELGRRLDYDVENGRYQGSSSRVGFDGIWRPAKGRSLVVEVKTSDAYRINLDTVASYKERLIAQNRIPDESAILIVVGRQDTGDLEAQVRGSRHAWDIRLISAEALVKLVSLKEDAEEDTASKIHELLSPFEYTRLDRIIDVAFTAAKEVGETVGNETAGVLTSSAQSADDLAPSTTQARTPRAEIDDLRKKIVGAVSVQKGQSLIKKSAALFWSSDEQHRLRIACTLSKRYPDGGYWYAYHPKWDHFLAGGTEGYLVLGCMDKTRAFALPFGWIRQQLPRLSKTENERDSYWHVYLGEEEGRIVFKVPAGERIDIESFAVSVVDL